MGKVHVEPLLRGARCALLRSPYPSRWRLYVCTFHVAILTVLPESNMPTIYSWQGRCQTIMKIASVRQRTPVERGQERKTPRCHYMDGGMLLVLDIAPVLRRNTRI